MDVDPDVVVVDHHRFAGVDPYAHPRLRPARPVGRGHSDLGLGDGGESGRHLGGGQEAGVALGAELDPAVAADRLPENRPVGPEQPPVVVAERAQQRGRALDVGEHQRPRPRRQLDRHHLHAVPAVPNYPLAP
jgi:hypothetical protein